jgi:hypothetical protein
MRIKIGLAILCLLLIGVFAFSGEVIKGNFSEITLNGDRRTTWPTVASDNGEINAATQEALDAKAPVDSPTFTGSVVIQRGLIDNVIIGESVPEIGYFTTLTSTYANFDDLAVASGFTSGGTSTVSGLFYSESLWVNDNVLISGETVINDNLTVSGNINLSGEIISQSYATTAADGEHYLNVANSTAPTDNVTIGDCYYDNVALQWLCWNGSAWAGAAGDVTASSETTFTNKTYDPSGTGNAFTHYAQKDFIILDPVAADNSMLFKARYAMTVSAVHCLAEGGGSITLQILECSSTGTSCAGIDGSTTITCDSDGAADDGSLSNASIDAGDWVQVLYGAPSGTVNTLTYSIYYSETQ